MLCHRWIVLLVLLLLIIIIIIMNWKKPYYLATVGPVVAGEEDRLRFAKSISLFSQLVTSSTRRGKWGRWNCKFYTTTMFFYRDSINPQCVVGSPVNLLCTLLWETVETIYNIYIWEYKRTMSIINERMSSSLTKTGSTFLFSNVFLGSSKDFILNFGGKLHFLKDNLYLYGY